MWDSPVWFWALQLTVPFLIVPCLPELLNPSCLQTTCAAGVPQKSSHTVPHSPPRHTSTLPSTGLEPFTNLTSPKRQPGTDSGECSTERVNYYMYMLFNILAHLQYSQVLEILDLEIFVSLIARACRQSFIHVLLNFGVEKFRLLMYNYIERGRISHDGSFVGQQSRPS